jgi:pimeloyl-ACP methyl ester carboxylesterase
MQTTAIIALALGLVLLGIYAFPLPTASSRVIYSKVPGAVVAALSSFRRRIPLKRFQAGRVTWHYLDAGAGRDAILFLHGMGGAGDIWFQQIEALRDAFRCIAVTYPPVAALDMLRSGILGILEQEGLSHVNVVGSSMGGYLAQYLAGSDPALVKKVVLGNTFPPNDLIPRRARLGVRYLPWVPEWAILAGVRKNTRRLLYPASGNSELVNAYLYEQTCGTMRKQDFIARCACLCQPFRPPDLDALGIPALIIASNNDPMVGADLQALLEKTYPSAAVKIFASAGHFPYLNRPEEFNRTLANFLTAS